MAVFPAQGGSNNTWGTELRAFFTTFFDLATGLFRTNVVPGDAIKTGEVTAAQLATDSVETVKIKDLNVTTGKLADTSVTSGKLADTSVTTGKLALLAVTDAQVAAANKDGIAGTASMRTLGTSTQQAASGNDSRFVTNGNSHDHEGGDGAQIDHVDLANKGTNTHTQLDAFVASKAAAEGLASLNALSTVVQNPANATATATASKIPIADGSGTLNTWVTSPAIAWITPSFDAGNFTASGSMTWTVAEADVTTFAFTVEGKRMIIVFTINTTSVGGTPSSDLRIAVPAGKLAAKEAWGVLTTLEAGTYAPGHVLISAGGTQLRCSKVNFANWSTSTNTTAVYGSIVFEIQ